MTNNDGGGGESSSAIIRCLSWVHCVAPTARSSLYERLRQKSAKLTDILPPSEYHLETNPDWVPSPTQPLSVLTVLSSNATLDAFLLGQYPLIQNLLVGCYTSLSEQAQVTSTLDVSNWWIYERTTNVSTKNSLHTPQLTWVSLPKLGTHRYTLQSVAVLYTQITTHLSKLPTRLAELTAAYTSSLKPLDLKWDALRRLLNNYNLEHCSMPKLIDQYILLGHSGCTENLSNAMDQFFTSMPMNE